MRRLEKALGRDFMVSTWTRMYCAALRAWAYLWTDTWGAGLATSPPPTAA